MNHECTDLNAGKFLHAYELGVLSAEDTEKFEIHLLKCEFCFNELKKNEAVVSTLLNDDAIKSIAKEASQVPKTKKSLWKSLWPEIPVVLRPAVTLTLLILLVYPAFLGLETLFEEDAKPARVISLVPSRSINGNVFEITQNTDIVLMFIYPKAEPGLSYKISIQNSKGGEIYRNDDFTDIDASKTGNLILSQKGFSTGSYKLTVLKNQVSGNPEVQEYNFKIIQH